MGLGAYNRPNAAHGRESNLMNAPKPNSRQRSEESHLRDITPALSGWNYEPGTLNVRRIVGLDGKPKVQLRLDLGVLQMEMSGRPDGTRPFGRESLLEHFEQQLAEHRQINGSSLGFHLTAKDCQLLREEASMYYHRYLSLYVLREFDQVVRDTERNLQVLDFCRRYAIEDHDRYVLEQFRPYLVMMRARAQASIHSRAGRYPAAMEVIRDALRTIRRFFRKLGQPEAFEHANEVKVLRRFRSDLRKRLPVDPVTVLRKRLDKAVRAEHYEEAARLRDEIARLAPSDDSVA